ncbi:DoxX family protein [Arenibaculum pallidiluteum]|uniref:DoxX family protein n=1 Tax=Arenibaculum pallidiluteum TaxID=2812559 RepID=UPI001A95BA2D|nr:DoxX family protein [Arenibaculum pallidiluteum]
MTDHRLTPYAALVLRLALGTMFLSHSLALKLFVMTLSGNAAFFESLGLPGALGHVVFAAELAGGTLLVLGVQTRWVALALAPILAGAVWVHAGNGWMFASANGGWEYPAYLTVLAVVQAMLGDGAFALSPSRPLPAPAAGVPAFGR